MLNDAETKTAKKEVEIKPAQVEIVDKPASPVERHDEAWMSLYSKSEIKSNFKIKPKHIDEKLSESGQEFKAFEYDVYIFNADLTDLSTDALVNASNPNLHPGYNGDGISRRIREKSGKQMQDACKRILKQDRNSSALNDADVVFTKSYGKLKSKYVLHAIAPTWTKYVLNNNDKFDKFEPLLEQTFTNILKQANDPKLSLNSIAFPVSNSSSGGAFDVPLDLCAHTLYTQLVDFPLVNTKLKTVCITSLELSTVKTLCEIFSTYTECYSTSTWAIPQSPMDRLLQQVLETKPPIPVKTIPYTNVQEGIKVDSKVEKEHFSSCSSVQSNSPKESCSSCSSTSSSSSLTYNKPQNENCYDDNGAKTERIFANGKITILNRNVDLNSQIEHVKTPTTPTTPPTPTSMQQNRLPVKQRLSYPANVTGKQKI